MPQQNTQHDQDKRTEFVGVRVTSEEMEHLRKVAYEQRLSMGGVMRNAFIKLYATDSKTEQQHTVTK